MVKMRIQSGAADIRHCFSCRSAAAWHGRIFAAVYFAWKVLVYRLPTAKVETSRLAERMFIFHAFHACKTWKISEMFAFHAAVVRVRMRVLRQADKPLPRKRCQMTALPEACAP
jgi:hypothetical protein